MKLKWKENDITKYVTSVPGPEVHDRQPGPLRFL